MILSAVRKACEGESETDDSPNTSSNANPPLSKRFYHDPVLLDLEAELEQEEICSKPHWRSIT